LTIRLRSTGRLVERRKTEYNKNIINENPLFHLIFLIYWNLDFFRKNQINGRNFGFKNYIYFLFKITSF